MKGVCLPPKPEMIASRMRSALRRCRDAYAVLKGSAFCYSKKRYACHSLSFSQEGEDGVLQRLFERKPVGFYVDVGSHHPQRFSNTYRFYLRGWRGINIDPLPGSKAQFDEVRSRDDNLELGVSSKRGILTYFEFVEPALNTFDSEVAEKRAKDGWPKLAESKIKVYPLRDILAQHIPPATEIDFFSIDVEGLDLDVLRSNDWSQFRPKYVLAEALEIQDIRQVQQTELHAFMESVNYSLFAKTMNTLFFVNSKI